MLTRRQFADTLADIVYTRLSRCRLGTRDLASGLHLRAYVSKRTGEVFYFQLRRGPTYAPRTPSDTYFGWAADPSGPTWRRMSDVATAGGQGRLPSALKLDAEGGYIYQTFGASIFAVPLDAIPEINAALADIAADRPS